MTTLREAAQQALEALHEIGWSNNTQWQSDRAAGVIPILRAALAEPDYWQEEARRYASNADYWRDKYKALAEPACCCGEPNTPGVVHRQGSPCYMPESVQSGSDRWQSQKRGCQVCGIGANGETVGYVCTRNDCPTRVTCGVAP